MQLIAKLNAAAREGRYNEDLWEEHTGHSVQELGAEWKRALEKRPVAPSPPPAMTRRSTH